MILLCGCTNQSRLTYSSSIDKENIRIQEIRNVSHKRAANLMKEKKKLILSMLKPVFDPYMGEVSNIEKCKIENLPSLKESHDSVKQILLISLYSSSENIFGQCAHDGSLKKTQFLSIYCKKNKELFFIKYFYDENNSWILEPVANCN